MIEVQVHEPFRDFRDGDGVPRILCAQVRQEDMPPPAYNPLHVPGGESMYRHLFVYLPESNTAVYLVGAFQVAPNALQCTAWTTDVDCPQCHAQREPQAVHTRGLSTATALLNWYCKACDTTEGTEWASPLPKVDEP